MLYSKTLILRVGLATLIAMVGLAQTNMPEAIRAQVERTQVVHALVGPVTNWATPLYWQPGAAAMQAGARVKRAESAGVQAAAESSTLGAPAVFVAMTPCRLVDTRVAAGFTGAFGPPAMPANTARTIPVPQSDCAIPAAVAYSLNLTVVPAPGLVLGWAAAWPDDQPQPNTAVLTDMIAGTIVSNSAIVPAGADGGFNILTLNATELVIDINGYFALPETLPFGGTAIAPALTFGDTTTGLYSTGAGSVSIATNGVNALTIGPTGNLDLPGSITKGGTLFLHNLEASGYPSTSTSVGLGALGSNAGLYNTALGTGALQLNTTGTTNTAAGAYALPHNTVGSSNTAVGINALFSNTEGYGNNAVGVGALGSNTTGYSNTAMGVGALQKSTTGYTNTALGSIALGALTTGDNNTALGYIAGANVGTGSYDVYIANAGPGNPNTGSPGTESNTIRIGDSNQNMTFIAGIRGATTGNADAIPVVIDSAGQLGTVSSSRRVKTDIADMGDTTDTLMSLRPVQFRYTAHGPDAPLQYGLIAEEVADVAPELVAHKAGGEIETVYYDKVNAMLLNEVQKLHRENESLKDQNQALKDQFAATLRQLESRLAALEAGGAK